MKKLAVIFLSFLSFFLLFGCDTKDSKTGYRTVHETSDIIEKTYTDASLKSELDYKKDASSQKAILFNELVAEDTKTDGISIVKLKFFIPTKTYKPYNSESIEHENWNMGLYYFEGKGTNVQKVDSVNFKLEEKNKTELNGVIGYQVEVTFWGLEIGTYKNPLYPNDKCDRILWEIFTDRILFRLKPEQGSSLRNKDDWSNITNNPYLVCKFIIQKLTLTVNDSDSDFRRDTTSNKYRHDLSENKEYGTPSK